jgi:hypothetical protein
VLRAASLRFLLASAADDRDPSIVSVEKWLVYRLAQFKPLLAKRFETTKTHSGHRYCTAHVRLILGCWLAKIVVGDGRKADEP